MNLQDIKNSIRNIPDFPKKGIQFKDITTALKNGKVLKEILETCAEHYKNQKIDYVVGIEFSVPSLPIFWVAVLFRYVNPENYRQK